MCVYVLSIISTIDCQHLWMLFNCVFVLITDCGSMVYGVRVAYS